MQTIQSRVYTNAILTVIAIFLAVIALQNFYDAATPAYAQREARERLVPEKGDAKSYKAESGDLAVAAANKEIASSLKDIADAIKESAKSTSESGEKIAKSLGQLK